MFDLLKALFSTEPFMPHGHCYLWMPSMVWLQVGSNLLIALSYFAITATLVYLIRRIRDIPFQWMYLAFALFIVACGTTHLFDVYTIWRPAYWADGTMRAITAAASLGTALLLPPLVPKAVALAEAASLAHERGLKLEQANLELGELLERSKELEQLKTRFFANVSHELRTPLALVLGPAERQLSSPAITSEQRRDLELIVRSARTLLKHVNDLLDISKLEAGKMKPDYTRGDLSRLVRRTCSHFDGLAGERGLTFTVVTPACVPAELDLDKIERVIVNLLSNAFKFTPSGGQVSCTLSADAQGQTAVLDVSDSGPGIRAEHRQLIFERFEQLDGGSTRRFGGTGLGLAIVREFVELHAGSIEVLAATHGGARFLLTLPVRAPEGISVRGEAVPGGESQGSLLQALDELRPRVEAEVQSRSDERPLALIVEDNVEMARFIADTLSPSYRTRVARDGHEGLLLAEQLIPDLILSDIMMPRSSGDQLLRELRARPAFAGVPILMLTAKADDELRVRLLSEGAQDYLTKPFSAEELQARVGNWLQVKGAREVLQRELQSQSRDIHALATQLAQRTRELSTALDSMRLARTQAEGASQFKSNFLNLVSHELRTPLSALVLQVERLRRDPSGMNAAQLSITERMYSSVNRLIELIESLLQYSRAERGKLVANVLEFDASELVRDVVGEYRAYAEQKGVTLCCASGQSSFIARSDARLIRLILVNLVSNALKFTDSGSVEVSFSEEQMVYRVSVTDTGCGVAPEHRARIFEPFEQLEPVSTKHVPGVGLGLALVREMVGALGGHIELDSQPGQGSRFVAAIPKAA